jgi:hypothetical protein
MLLAELIKRTILANTSLDTPPDRYARAKALLNRMKNPATKYGKNIHGYPRRLLRKHDQLL